MIKDLIKILFFLLIRIIPKKKNLLVFGDRAGRRFADNSRYLYFYMNKNYPEFQCIWLSKNEKILTYLKKNNFHACDSTSLKGIYCCLRAKFHIFNFVEDDIHKLITLYSDSILLWHGVLPKKLQKIDIKTSSISKFLNKKMKKFFIYPNKQLSQNIFDRFPHNKYKLLVSNIPRNLIFKENASNNMNIFRTHEEIDFNRKIKIEKKKIFGYFPTWRSDGLELFRDIHNPKDLKKIDNVLDSTNSLLLVKRHMNSDKKDENRMYNKNVENIMNYMQTLKNFRFIDYDFDLNSVLSLCDVLISDYSGVIFDFLYQDKPIITYAPDYEEFKINNGFSLDPVEKNFTHYAKNIEELEKYIIEFSYEKKLFTDKFKKERKQIKDQVFLDEEGFNKIIEIIKK